MNRHLYSALALCLISGTSQAALDPTIPSWKAVMDARLEGSMMMSLEKANPLGLEAVAAEATTNKALSDTFSKTPYGVSDRNLYEPSVYAVRCTMNSSRPATEAVIFNTLRALGYVPGPSRSLDNVQQVIFINAENTAPNVVGFIEYKCGSAGGFAQVDLWQVGTSEQLAFTQKRYSDRFGAEREDPSRGVTSLSGVRLLNPEVQEVKGGAIALRLKNSTSSDVVVTLRVVLYSAKGPELKVIKRRAVVNAQGSFDRTFGAGDERATKAQIRLLDVRPYEATGEPIEE